MEEVGLGEENAVEAAEVEVALVAALVGVEASVARLQEAAEEVSGAAATALVEVAGEMMAEGETVAAEAEAAVMVEVAAEAVAAAVGGLVVGRSGEWLG